MNLNELHQNFGLLPVDHIEQLIENRDRVSLAGRFCAWICGK